LGDRIGALEFGAMPIPHDPEALGLLLGLCHRQWRISDSHAPVRALRSWLCTRSAWPTARWTDIAPFWIAGC
jgi:hypothetical protein